ncbi:DEAD/DEAH box helicase [archaeon]|nr:DEAD/DEAH box helicase [archaeon]
MLSLQVYWYKTLKLPKFAVSGTSKCIIMKFSDLNIDKRILKSLSEMGFTEMTDIQEKTLPVALDGRDLIAQAMTGSGKTAAFGIPIAQHIERGKGIQAIVLTPTRELAVQVATEVKKFSKNSQLRTAIVYGGVSIEPQISELRHAEVVVGTPGRVLDHMQRGTLRLGGIKIFVLDEADRMLDMGFIDDIRRIISALPEKRQTMLFSATMPDEIVYIAKRYMKNPARIKTQTHISKHLLKHIYYDVRHDEKLSTLSGLIEKEKPSLAIIFCGTRRMANVVERYLRGINVEAKAIHGGLTQQQRSHIMDGFHRGRPHILVATDVAARGLDIKDVSHIFNFDVPKTAEDYTHRTGRTARFGKTGKAITILSKDDHESFRKIIRHIEIERGILDFKPVPVRMQSSYTHSNRNAPRRRFGNSWER